MIGSYDVIYQVNKMDWLEKQLLYLKYYSKQISFELFYNFKATKPVSFEEFCNYDSIKWINIGENWDKLGYAQEEWCCFTIHSIYWWHHIYSNQPNYKYYKNKQ